MQLSKEEYARKRIHNGSPVQTENSVTWVTGRHHSATLMMQNSYPRDGIFNQHLTTILIVCFLEKVFLDESSQLLIYFWSGTEMWIHNKSQTFRHAILQYKLCKTTNWTSMKSCIN